MGIKIPSIHNLLEDEERVRKVFKESGSVRKALRSAKYLTTHEVLRICAEEKLKILGYNIVNRSDAPRWIKDVGSPDIIAEKDGEFVLVEVKPSGQFKRYSATKAKFIIVTNVEEGGKVDIWGIRELEEI